MVHQRVIYGPSPQPYIARSRNRHRSVWATWCGDRHLSATEGGGGRIPGPWGGRGISSLPSRPLILSRGVARLYTAGLSPVASYGFRQNCRYGSGLGNMTGHVTYWLSMKHSCHDTHVMGNISCDDRHVVGNIVASAMTGHITWLL